MVKKSIMNKESNYIIKGLIYQEDITQINVYKTKTDRIEEEYFVDQTKYQEYRISG